MKDKPYVFDWRKSYLLDTQAKVDWANNLPPEASTGRPWKLGDLCYYVPKQPIEDLLPRHLWGAD